MSSEYWKVLLLKFFSLPYNLGAQATKIHTFSTSLLFLGWAEASRDPLELYLHAATKFKIMFTKLNEFFFFTFWAKIPIFWTENHNFEFSSQIRPRLYTLGRKSKLACFLAPKFKVISKPLFRKIWRENSNVKKWNLDNFEFSRQIRPKLYLHTASKLKISLFLGAKIQIKCWENWHLDNFELIGNYLFLNKIHKIVIYGSVCIKFATTYHCDDKFNDSLDAYDLDTNLNEKLMLFM